MDGSGFYNEHSAQQQEAAAAGRAMLIHAAREVPLPSEGPLIIADYGSSEGKNSLTPLGSALDQLASRDDGSGLIVCVVHTDLPGNDFSSLFETVADDPGTYARPGVFTFAAGRSFYQQLFPANTVSAGWSATAVVWLSHTPCPLPDHLFSYAASGQARQTWREAAAEDWNTFLRMRATELRSGGEMVVTTLVSGSNYLDWMALIEAGAADALAAGSIRNDEYEAMAIPTYIREADEFFGPIDNDGLPLRLVDSTVATAADPAYESFRQHGDPVRYSREAVAAYRAWSEPAMMSGIDAGRSSEERSIIADALYEHTRVRLEATPTACAWNIGLARIRREPR